MRKTECIEWGWLSPKDGRLVPQTETFPSADAAIEAMQKRLGDPEHFTLERIAELGFRLTMLRITLEPMMVLTPVADVAPDSAAGTSK